MISMPKRERLGNQFSSTGFTPLSNLSDYGAAVTSLVKPDRPMPATPADLFAFLDKLGVAYKTTAHPPLFTVEQSQTLRGQIPGTHTKNLFLVDRKRGLYLIVACEDAIIELKNLHRHLNTGRFSFASADLLRETLGVEPGSVTPFAAMNDFSQRVTIVLDAAMMRHPTLNFHPLVNTMTTSIGREGLLQFLDATGHRVRIEAVARQDPA
jgi:Ala-tRNA(Pro) deacylase